MPDNHRRYFAIHKALLRLMPQPNKKRLSSHKRGRRFPLVFRLSGKLLSFCRAQGGIFQRLPNALWGT